MKSIVLYTPWGNRWKKSLTDAFNRAGIKAEWVPKNGSTIMPDAILSMWCNEFIFEIQDKYPGMKLYTFIRHYESFTDMPAYVNWDKIAGLFYCAPHVKDICEYKWPGLRNVPSYIIPNWIDPDEFPFSPKPQGHKIAMIGRIHPAKLFPMAVQILAKLPSEYTIEVAGANQDESMLFYMQNILEDMNLIDRFTFYGHVDDIHKFLSDKSYILSTSMREGCPMNVLEAMSTGLKPVIHNWLGSKQFIDSQYIFNTSEEACAIIQDIEYAPGKYRAIVEKNYGLQNAERLVSIINGTS